MSKEDIEGSKPITAVDVSKAGLYDDLLVGRLLHILIVEDNVINRLILIKMLEGIGHKFMVASDGQEACNLVAENDFDLIIMDVHMPVMDGIEATISIRKSGNSIPIIGCTADSYAEEVAKFKEQGMDDVVIKPVHFKSLLVSINMVMNEEIHTRGDGKKLTVPPVLNFT